MHPNKKKILFRLDAGSIFGMGHLSRCVTLANSFGCEYNITFWVKTDSQQKVESFLEKRLNSNDDIRFDFFEPEIPKKKDVEAIISYCAGNDVFLILDHYSLDDNYQKTIADAGIRFLLFDSHGISNLYADAILHASPSATHEVYKPLLKNPNALLLLGTSYAIMDYGFAKAREGLQVRTSLKNILICMGGGNDKGASLKILQFLETFPLNDMTVEVIVGENHPDFETVRKLCFSIEQFIHIPGTKNMPEHMRQADLGIIASGTLSYEAACMGMPMLLCVIADNQNMNAEGWDKLDCAINMGKIEKLQQEDLTSYLKLLLDNTTKLQEMSEKGMRAVDGLGVFRVKEQIDQLIHSQFTH
ncbi:MAG: UDP-2,4-diacetamido-2,4,6-trideoxy-beta-L-altropyranose hydrolase [Bacteroidales bacterium]